MHSMNGAGSGAPVLVHDSVGMYNVLDMWCRAG